MKKLLLLLFILCSLSGYSQWLKPNNSYGTIFNRGAFDITLTFPTGCGAPTTLNAVDRGQMAFYGDSCSNTLYYYSPKTKAWSPIFIGGGGSRVDSMILRDSILCIWQGGSSICTDLKKDTVDIGYGLGTNFDSTGRQTIFAIHPDGVEGGTVSYAGTGLNYNVLPLTVFYNNRVFTFPASLLTLGPANSQPRYDLFYADTLGAHIKTGDTATVPLIPQLNPGQYALTSGFLVNPGDTIPSGITSTTIYNEPPVGWEPGTQSGASIVNFYNTDNPYRGTKDIFVSSYHDGAQIYFIDSPFVHNDANTNGLISLPIYLNGALPAGNNIYISFVSFDTLTGLPLLINSDLGFNRNLANQYQQVVIPYSKVQWQNGAKFTTLELTFTGNDTSGAKGLYIDYVTLQSGIPNIPPPTDYSNKADSAGTYKLNDSTYITKTWVKGVGLVVGDTIHIKSSGGSGSGAVNSVTGNPVGLVDNTDPANPVVQQDVLKLNKADSTATGYYPYSTNPKNYLTAVDTTNISNFSIKVRSLFSATAPITYNSATGLFGITAMNATTNGYVTAGGSASKVLHGDGTWKDTTANTSGFTNPMTTNGDIIAQVSGVPSRVGIGSKGYVLKNSNGSLGWNYPDQINVVDYGAVGDGTTDCRAAFIKADSVLNAKGGGVLFVPVGAFYISDSINVPFNVRITGVSDAGVSFDNTKPITSSVIVGKSSTTSIFVLGPAGYSQHKGTANPIENLNIVYEGGSTPTAGEGIRVYDGGQFLIQHVSFSGFWIDCDIQAGQMYRILFCDFNAPVKYGLNIQNLLNADAGDMAIDLSLIHISEPTRQ